MYVQPAVKALCVLERSINLGSISAGKERESRTAADNPAYRPAYG